MNQRKGKENTNGGVNCNRACIGSTYRVEADQKELIIKGLRSDQDTLKKNEHEYHRLHDQYKHLQHKYKVLCD